mgnify:FL=1
MPNITRLMLESVAVGVPLGLSVVLDRLCFEAGCSAASDTFKSIKHKKAIRMFVLIDSSKKDNDERNVSPDRESLTGSLPSKEQLLEMTSRTISPTHERL